VTCRQDDGAAVRGGRHPARGPHPQAEDEAGGEAPHVLRPVQADGRLQGGAREAEEAEPSAGGAGHRQVSPQGDREGRRQQRGHRGEEVQARAGTQNLKVIWNIPQVMKCFVLS